MAYRPDWWPKDKDGTESVGVLDLAQALHEHVTGASDPMPPKEVEECARALRWVLANWNPSNRGRNDSYDKTVRTLINVALVDFEISEAERREAVER